jgi:hypothetical protein
LFGEALYISCSLRKQNREVLTLRGKGIYSFDEVFGFSEYSVLDIENITFLGSYSEFIWP